MYWEGDHVRLLLTSKDSKGISKELVRDVSSVLRGIGCRCVLDDSKRLDTSACSSELDRVNRFSALHVEDSSLDDDGEDDHSVNVDCVSSKVGTLGKSAGKKRWRVATFSGLCSEHKQKEVEEYLVKNDIDVVAGQESWEKEDTRINVDGYKWFGKPRSSQTSQRGEGGVGFLVRECLVSKVEFISQVNYDESLWLKLRGERGRGALFVYAH